MLKPTGSRVSLLIVTISSVIAVGLCGCGNREPIGDVSVQGTVTVDGLPVPSGAITLIPMEGLVGPSGGTKIEDGHFEILPKQNLVAGRYQVEIVSVPKRPEGTPVPKPTLTGPADPWDVAHPPQSFKDPSQTVELQSGDNKYDLDLRSKH